MKDADELLTPAETAAILKKSVGCLANMRCDSEWKRKLPFVKIGRSVRYRKTDIQKFLKGLSA